MTTQPDTPLVLEMTQLQACATTGLTRTAILKAVALGRLPAFTHHDPARWVVTPELLAGLKAMRDRRIAKEVK